jgi:phosphoribosylformylglycinamidine synthase subunit PurL
MYSLPRVARGACAAVIGKVTDTGRYVAKYRGDVVMDVDLEFLTSGVRYSRPYVLPVVEVESPAERERILAGASATGASLGERLLRVLAHRDVSDRASIYSRYDGVVRGCTAIPPGHADAGLLVPVPGAPLAVAVGIGGNPRYGKLDPRGAAELAVAEAIGRVSAVGAIPVGLTDCLNFGDPTVPEQMGAFVAAVEGLSHAARHFDVPFVSGNVSLYNRSSSGNHVAPSPIVGCIGTVADVARTTTRGFKRAGSAIVVTATMQYASGGSVIADILGLQSTTLPELDVRKFASECTLVRRAIERGVVASAHLVGDGGLLTAIAKMALASDRGLGFRLDPRATAEARLCDAAWFTEGPAFVLEVVEPEGFAHLTAELSVAAYDVGEVLAEPVAVLGEERVTLSALREAWEAPLRDFYGAPALRQAQRDGGAT